jgi:hypothetical protein
MKVSTTEETYRMRWRHQVREDIQEIIGKWMRKRHLQEDRTEWRSLCHSISHPLGNVIR